MCISVGGHSRPELAEDLDLPYDRGLESGGDSTQMKKPVLFVPDLCRFEQSFRFAVDGPDRRAEGVCIACHRDLDAQTGGEDERTDPLASEAAMGRTDRVSEQNQFGAPLRRHTWIRKSTGRESQQDPSGRGSTSVRPELTDSESDSIRRLVAMRQGSSSRLAIESRRGPIGRSAGVVQW